MVQDSCCVPRGDVQAAGSVDAARFAAGPERGVLREAGAQCRGGCCQPGGGGGGPRAGGPEWETAARTTGPGENYNQTHKITPIISMCFKQTPDCASVWGGQRLIEEENMLAPSLQQFSLRTEMLPSYIPIRVAEKILFVGESVQMFENHNHSQSPSRAGSVFCCDPSDILYFSKVTFLSLQYITKTIHLNIVLCISGSILKHQEDLFAAGLHRLKQQPLFSLVDFENLIDHIRSTVAEVSSHTNDSSNSLTSVSVMLVIVSKDLNTPDNMICVYFGA